jgi:Ca2+-binding EF-hand superfamily protein
MRKTTLTVMIAGLLGSGAAVAGGGDYDKSDAMKDEHDKAKIMAVEKIDRQNAVQAFNEADADSDFKLNKDEAARIKGLKEKFAELDEDGDGAIDYSEFRSLTQADTGR